jgi:hypothetical protein
MSGLPPRLGAFAAALALAFVAAFTIGAAADPLGAADAVAEDHVADAGGDEAAHDPHADAGTGADEAALPGLAVSASGYTLVAATTDLRAGSEVPFRFTVTGPDRQPVTSYRTTHEKDLHLIVVRRDLTAFQHVHPTRSSDGTWTVALDLPTAGTYRVFADFAPAGLTTSLTLGTDIFVAGDFSPRPLPAAAASDTVDGYTVRMDNAPAHGGESELTFTVTKDGEPVTDLEPYLGAFGHLVSLRVGDLAYLHTHPAEEAEPDQRGGPSVRFGTEFPTAGTYRLFLDFKVGGSVRTAAFTVTS